VDAAEDMPNRSLAAGCEGAVVAGENPNISVAAGWVGAAGENPNISVAAGWEGAAGADMLNKSAEGCDAATAGAADAMLKRSPAGWEDADGAAADPNGSLPHPPVLLASVLAGAGALA
jgi:hypothetical protein